MGESCAVNRNCAGCEWKIAPRVNGELRGASHLLGLDRSRLAARRLRRRQALADRLANHPPPLLRLLLLLLLVTLPPAPAALRRRLLRRRGLRLRRGQLCYVQALELVELVVGIHVEARDLHLNRDGLAGQHVARRHRQEELGHLEPRRAQPLLHQLAALVLGVRPQAVGDQPLGVEVEVGVVSVAVAEEVAVVKEVAVVGDAQFSDASENCAELRRKLRGVAPAAR